jgi:VIT1/CCC1 family predicted Fe2+/Mn2+ transporter
MSLVALKHFFFSETRTPVPARGQNEHSKLLDHRSPENSLSDSLTIDVESQHSDSSSSRSSSKRPFKIDARLISDATIGLSDGLTVPFALTAGLSALGNTKIVIYGGIAELLAGAISMGLGGYLGAKSEA